MAEFPQPTRDWRKIDEPHLIETKPRSKNYLKDQLFDEHDIREARLKRTESARDQQTAPQVAKIDTNIQKALKWPMTMDLLPIFVASAVTFWAGPVLSPENSMGTFFVWGYLSGALVEYSVLTVKE